MSLITEELYRQMGIRRSVVTFGESVCEELKERFDAIDAIAEYNQLKVIQRTGSATPAFSLPAGTDMTTWEEIRWKRFMQISFIPRTRWSVRRSPAGLMP